MWSIVARNNNTNRPGSCIDSEENMNKNVIIKFNYKLEIIKFF